MTLQARDIGLGMWQLRAKTHEIWESCRTRIENGMKRECSSSAPAILSGVFQQETHTIAAAAICSVIRLQ